MDEMSLWSRLLGLRRFALPKKSNSTAGRYASGAEILLAPYYSASGRIEQDFAHLVQSQAAGAAPATAICQAEACCANKLKPADRGKSGPARKDSALRPRARGGGVSESRRHVPCNLDLVSCREFFSV